MSILCMSSIIKRKFKGAVTQQAGFTLIELMITISIIGIMIAVAVPDIINWLPNYRLKSAVNDLYSNMQKAKMEALKNNTDVIIIFTPAAYVSAGRAGSYLIFVDNSPSSGAAGPGVEDRIISQVTMPKNVSLYFDNFAGNTTGFNSRGLPWNNRWGNVRMQNNNSRYYQISFSSAGSLKINSNNDGITGF